MQDQKQKDIIIKASLAFKRYGIKSVTMDDLCREIGISKKTLYQLFANKDELVELVVLAESTNIVELFKEKTSLSENAIDTLLSVSIEVSKLISDISPAYSYDLKKYYPELFERHLESKKRISYGLIRDNIMHGINQKLYRAEIETDMVAHFYIGNIETVMSAENIFCSEYPKKDMFKIMVENHIRSIATEKGITYFENRLKTLNLNL